MGLVNNLCIFCPVGCAVCINSTVCVSCTMYYSLVNNTCVYCNDSYCVVCTAPNACLMCQAKYQAIN